MSLAILVMFALFALFGAVVYGIFQSKRWLLGLLISIPLVLAFASLVNYQSAESKGELTTVTDGGVSRVVQIDNGEVTEIPPDYHFVGTTTRMTWVGLFPLLGVMALLAFLAVKAFAGHDRHREGQYEDRHARPHHVRSGFPWGWALAGVAILLLAGLFVLRLGTYEQQMVMEAPATVVEVGGSSSAQVQPNVPEQYSNRPTAELWEKLTEARIDLDGEDEAESAEETAKTENDVSDSNSIAVQAEQQPEAPPGWVENPPKPIGNVYRVVATSDLFSTEDECYGQLEEQFYAELLRCMKRIFPKDQRDLLNLHAVSEMGVPLNYIMQGICRDSYTEVVDTSVGPMKKVHVLMEFDSGIQQELREKWITYRRGLGLATVSKIFTLLLGSLAIGFVLLQVDTWTRGYYTKRLLLGLPVAIIAIALLLLA